jgi:hypothetical protein
MEHTWGMYNKPTGCSTPAYGAPHKQTNKTVSVSFIFVYFMALRFKDTDIRYTPINYSLLSCCRSAYYIAVTKGDWGLNNLVKYVYFGLLGHETMQRDLWMLKLRKHTPLRISVLLKYTSPKRLHSPTSLRGIINWNTGGTFTVTIAYILWDTRISAS